MVMGNSEWEESCEVLGMIELVGFKEGGYVGGAKVWPGTAVGFRLGRELDLSGLPGDKQGR